MVELHLHCREESCKIPHDSSLKIQGGLLQPRSGLQILFDDGEDLPVCCSFLVWQQQEGTRQDSSIVQLSQDDVHLQFVD